MGWREQSRAVLVGRAERLGMGEGSLTVVFLFFPMIFLVFPMVFMVFPFCSWFFPCFSWFCLRFYCFFLFF